jgi:cytochrome c oxidase subunit 2
MRMLVIIALFALAAFGIGYYFAGAGDTVYPNAAVAPGTDVAPLPSEDPAGAAGDTATTSEEDIAVSAFNYGYTPSVITVKKGEHVKITLTDTGGLHDFIIDEFNAKTPRIETGATTSVEFDANLAGTFQYYSSFGNDRANGMWGTIIVAP